MDQVIEGWAPEDIPPLFVRWLLGAEGLQKINRNYTPPVDSHTDLAFLLQHWLDPYFWIPVFILSALILIVRINLCTFLFKVCSFSSNNNTTKNNNNNLLCH
jgi:hypothetical protein